MEKEEKKGKVFFAHLDIGPSMRPSMRHSSIAPLYAWKVCAEGHSRPHNFSRYPRSAPARQHGGPHDNVLLAVCCQPVSYRRAALALPRCPIFAR